LTRINDGLEVNTEFVEALTCLFESQGAADGDFCGEQREWHKPRLDRAAFLMCKLFPNHVVHAMLKAKSPHDNGGKEDA
jgi:hypothetical protein